MNEWRHSPGPRHLDSPRPDLVYLDDILVISKNLEEHAEHLQTVLQLLRTNKLSVKLSKCEFNKPEVKFQGHIVGKDGIKVDPEKIVVVRNWQQPKDVSDLWKFLIIIIIIEGLKVFGTDQLLQKMYSRVFIPSSSTNRPAEKANMVEVVNLKEQAARHRSRAAVRGKADCLNQ